MKNTIKWIYKFVLYDSEKGTSERIGEMPERRRDPKRMGRETIINWLRCTYGAEWYEKNKSRIGIVKVKVQPEEDEVQAPWPGLLVACDSLIRA